MLIEKREKIVYASHNQFYIEDADEMGDTGSDDFWTDQAFEILLAYVPNTIGISTASYGDVKVVMEWHDKSPQLELEQWDHIAETDLKISQGKLQIVGCLDEENRELFDVPAGKNYRVRCCYANLAEGGESEEGKDWYLVQFWQAKPTKLTILKQYSLTF